MLGKINRKAQKKERKRGGKNKENKTKGKRKLNPFSFAFLRASAAAVKSYESESRNGGGFCNNKIQNKMRKIKTQTNPTNQAFNRQVQLPRRWLLPVFAGISSAAPVCALWLCGLVLFSKSI